MARLYLVRHGEPSGTWEDSHDPGLTDLGKQQAKTAADRLRLVTPKQIITSPLRRALETAMPLAETLNMQPAIRLEISEIPTPPNMALEHRADWLRAIMTRSWTGLEPGLRHWRDGIVKCLTNLDADTAIFSHFVAINAALGAAIGDDRVLCFRPAHASVTILESYGPALSLIELGQTADTTVR